MSDNFDPFDHEENDDAMMEDTPEKRSSMLSMVVRGLIALAVLGGAFLVAGFFVLNPAETKKTGQSVDARVVVTTETVTLDHYPIEIEVMGQVRAAQEIALKTQVAGEIVMASDEFIPGGFFNEGDVILQIDPSDYILDIKTKRASLKQAEATLALEQGQQAIAQDELKILEQSTGKTLNNSDLALRKPQLEQARATIDSAKAALDMAELALKRTMLRSPFDAIITQRNTDLGNIVSIQDTLATMVNTNEYWIDIEVPLDHLHWLTVPKSFEEDGTRALIKLDSGRGYRGGYLIKMKGTLDQQTRLAGMTVSVPDPLLLEDESMAPRKDGFNQAPLILGDYVQVTLIGKPIHAARLPLRYIRDNAHIWIMRNDKLIIQPVEIAYEDRTYAYITKGIEDGDAIVTSNIVTPIDGMALSQAGEQ